MFEFCESTTRPSARRRSHPRLDSSEVLHSDGAQAGGQTNRLHLHDAAGPPRAVPPAGLRVTPAGASTARPSHVPAPPYQLAVQTRHRIVGMTPERPTAGTSEHRRIAQPNTGRPCASPSPSLHSTSASAWAAQAHAPAASSARDDPTPQHAASLPLPPEALIRFPQCRNLGPRHQSKFTLRKNFRAAHTPPLADDHAAIFRKIPPDRHCMPQNRRYMPQC